MKNRNMAAQRGAASSPGDAVAQTQAAVRRTGAAWNRHDTAAVRANLELARELRVPRLMLDYGGLRFRYDILSEGQSVVQPAVIVQVEGDGDVQMENDQPVGRSDSADAPARPPVQIDSLTAVGHLTRRRLLRMLLSWCAFARRQQRQRHADSGRRRRVNSATRVRGSWWRNPRRVLVVTRHLHGLCTVHCGPPPWTNGRHSSGWQVR